MTDLQKRFKDNWWLYALLAPLFWIVAILKLFAIIPILIIGWCNAMSEKLYND